MPNRQIVSFDLGSAYTKIAVRRDWNDESELVTHPRLGRGESQFFIPSVVASVRRSGSTYWQIGVEAAEQKPGPNVQIFQNWKAALFNPQAAQFDVHEIARNFFVEMRERFSEGDGRKNVSHLPVRVCIPKFGNTDQVERSLVEILISAGWAPCAKRPIVFEPESNILGLITRGMNRTGFQNSSDRRIQFQAMLELGPVKTAFRETREGGYGVCVIDIGAFTTDFAYLRFDTDHSTVDWTQPDLVQESAEVGIRNLRSSIFDILGPEIERAVSQLTVSEQDEIVDGLLSGRQRELVVAGKGRMRIGGPDHLERIADAIRVFAQRVWTARESFHARHVPHSLHPEYVTGGGSLIQGIYDLLEAQKASRLKQSFPDAKCYTTVELLNPREIRQERERERYAVRSHQLRRGASALGACSVFFEFNTGSLGSPYPPSFREQTTRR